MKNLKNIKINNLIKWWEYIVKYKDDPPRNGLLGIRNDIFTRFEDYRLKFSGDEIFRVENSNYPKNHPALVSCYKSEGKTLSALKKRIRDLQDDKIKGVCQYCGLGKPKTMDHFLPIGDYPEFSVYAINLIPCCKDCNEIKKAYWKDNDGRGIINYYLDNFLDFQFLFCDIVFSNNIPVPIFRLENYGNLINGNHFEIIEKHFRRLGLLKRYDDEKNDELGEIIRNIKLYVTDFTPQFIQTKLLEDADQLKNQFGNNYWRGVLRQALANSASFLYYLTH